MWHVNPLISDSFVWCHFLYKQVLCISIKRGKKLFDNTPRRLHLAFYPARNSFNGFNGNQPHLINVFFKVLQVFEECLGYKHQVKWCKNWTQKWLKSYSKYIGCFENVSFCTFWSCLIISSSYYYELVLDCDMPTEDSFCPTDIKASLYAVKSLFILQS